MMHPHLGEFLDPLQRQYHTVDYLSSDPLEFLHRYENPWDQEAVGLVSALLAYGNVTQIRKSIENCLSRMAQVSDSPSHFVRSLTSNPGFKRRARRTFQGFVHRFNTGEDLIHLFDLLSRSWATYGSLGRLYLSFLDPHAQEIGPALSSLIQRWKSWLPPEAKSSGLLYLLNSPKNGSCCKRWCLFLRWMGRLDDLDPGLWTRARPGALLPSHQKTFLAAHQLVMPLDTHTGRISQYLGLTSKKTVNWKMALEVTESLKKVDPSDPTRYDFALSRLGILDLCQRSYREEVCKKCQLLPVCHWAQSFSRSHFVSMQS